MITSFDFLTEQVEGPDLRRDGRFRITAPWQRMRYRSLRFRAGWWKLVCEQSCPSGAEVTLRSAADPLIILPASASSRTRIFLSGAEARDLSLLVSCWPGEYQFSVLRLERVADGEAAAMLVWRTLQATKDGRFVAALGDALRQRLTGGAVGVRLDGDTPRGAAHMPATASHLPELRCQERDGLHVLMRAGDRLHPDAIAIVKERFASSPDSRFIFADTLEGGHLLPKPGRGEELARYYAYFSTPVFSRAPHASPEHAREEISRTIQRDGETGALRIALPLASRDNVYREHLSPPASPDLPTRPCVSILVPTKYRTDLLAKCLTSLIQQTNYAPKEVIVIDNGSVDPKLSDVLTSAKGQLPLRTLVDHRPFNFSQLINAAAAEAQGDLLLLLNDDIEAVQPDWLHRMVQSAIEEDTGVVGARLCFPDGAIQHAGVTLGIGGLCGHLWKHTLPDEASVNPYIVYPGERSAVTGACLLVRRSDFQKVGGLDEQFPFNYGDIDLCLRVRALGLRVIYRGDAVLVHHESRSTGMKSLRPRRLRADATAQRAFYRRWSSILADDPFGSPAFDPLSERGRARAFLLSSWMTVGAPGASANSA